MDDEQGRRAPGVGRDLDGDNFKFPVSVVKSEVVPTGVSLSGGERRWLCMGHHVAGGTSADPVTPRSLGEADLHPV